ncbi:hypothetical protein M0811_05551 [Anaeramoeba ignava]|uniref:Uncharacterized protein n=1 Tax=Anaeramoeba ignava TaxID=1746090 RepID=A0A9Q0REK4_ANAIG|nr:hypothetical protein M0811_05551 [Anaeramoeba ignava]
MCWNFESSLLMGSWGVIVSSYAIIRNASYRDRWTGWFLLITSTMQFVDTVFWYDHKINGLETCSNLNKYTSKYFIHLVLSAELLAAVIAAGKMGNFMKKYHYIPNILGAIRVANPFERCTTLSPQGHILWFGTQIKWHWSILFLIAVDWPLLFMKPFIAGLSYVSLISGVWLYSTLYTDAFGSNWCFLSTFCSILLLFDPFIFGRFFPEKKQKVEQKRKN